MIFIDHSPLPAIYGTGSEDYFNNAWGYGEPFTFAYYGAPLLAKHAEGEFNTLYRFHLPDPIHFREHIRVTMECWWLRTQTVGISSVAFWYQDRPMRSRPPLPAGRENHPHFHPLPPEDRWQHGDGGPALGQTRVGGYELEAAMRLAGIKHRLVSVVNGQGLGIFGGSGIVLETAGAELAIPIPAPADGRYRVEVKPLYGLLEGPLSLRLEGSAEIVAEPRTFAREDDGPFLVVGEVAARDGSLNLYLKAPRVAAIQALLLTEL